MAAARFRVNDLGAQWVSYVGTWFSQIYYAIMGMDVDLTIVQEDGALPYVQFKNAEAGLALNLVCGRFRA